MQAFASTAQVGALWNLSVYVSGASSGIGPLNATVSASTSARSAVSCPPSPARLGFYTCAGVFAEVGAFALLLTYSGDDNTLPCTLSTTVTVGKAAPGVYIAASPEAPVYGQQETIGVLVLG